MMWEQTMTAHLSAQENLGILEVQVLPFCPSCEQSSGEKCGASLQADHSDHGPLVGEMFNLVWVIFSANRMPFYLSALLHRALLLGQSVRTLQVLPVAH